MKFGRRRHSVTAKPSALQLEGPGFNPHFNPLLTTQVLMKATTRARPSTYGMTRKMFIPMSLTLFGTGDYVAEVEEWFHGKSVVTLQPPCPCT